MKKARVEKIILNLQDENLLVADLEFVNMRSLMAQICPLVYQDIIKEEYKDIQPDWKIGRVINRLVPAILREIIESR